MTLEEMKAAGERYEAINAAKKRLTQAQQVLDLINAHGRTGSVWRPTLILKKAEPYTYQRDISIEIAVPFGVVQQQAVYAVEAARREIIMLGGTP